MSEYRPSMETKSYQFDKIEKDIIEGFLMEENLKSSLAIGVNKYSWYWSKEQSDEVGEYSALIINTFEINPSTKHADAIPTMKIIPVDKFERIVQTTEQRKKYADRAALTQKMKIQMEQQGIKLKAEKSQSEKTPSFAPLSDPEFIEAAKGKE